MGCLRTLALCLLVLPCCGAAFAQGGPVCTVTPDSLNFGTCWIPDIAEMAFTISNDGDDLLEGTIAASGSDFWLRDFEDGHAFSLPPGGELDVWVSTERTFPHDHWYAGSIIVDAAGGAEVPCYAIYQDAPQDLQAVDCYAHPTLLDFGAVVMGEVSETLEYTIGNIGTRAMQVTIPDRLGDFHFEWPGVYPQTAWVDRFVGFRPQTAGAHQCTLFAAPACGDMGEFVVLRGEGLYPYAALEMDAEALDFGMILVGESGTRSLTITNTGNEAVSGFLTVTGEGFLVPEDERNWNVLPGATCLVTVDFEPVVPGERYGSLDLGHELCDTVVLHAVGIEPSVQHDIIGIYFEQSGQVGTFETTSDFEEVTAYLMVINPSSSTGIRAWECCVEMAGAGTALSFDLAGETMNVDQPPCFIVGMTGYPLQGENLITLATLHFWQPSPDDATWFYIHPASQPSIPDQPCYVDGVRTGVHIPLGWAKGNELLPVAVVNDPTSGVGTPPPPAVSGLGNYPNPFNPGTTIGFVLGAEATATLRVYDLGGRVVRTLLAGEVLEVGRCEIPWDGRDDVGRAVAAGIYIYRLEAGDHLETKRMALVK